MLGYDPRKFLKTIRRCRHLHLRTSLHSNIAQKILKSKVKLRAGPRQNFSLCLIYHTKCTLPQVHHVVLPPCSYRYHDISEKEIPRFKDLAVERKAGNIDTKSRIKLDNISKEEYNCIMKNICDLKMDISGKIANINTKVSKLEEIMTDFLKKLNDAFPDAANTTSELGGRILIDNEYKVCYSISS